MKIIGIYRVTSKATNKIYIGESFNILKRIIRHKTDLKYKIHCNPYLQRHVNVHGLNDLVFEVLEKLSPDPKILMEREKFWIDFYKSNDPDKGFNLNEGGTGGYVTTIRYKDFTLVRLKDGSKHTFHTIEDYEEHTCFNRHKVREVLSGKRKTSYGWTTVDNYNLIENKRAAKIALLNHPKKVSVPPRYIKSFSVKNIITNETFCGKNVMKFSHKNNLCYNSMLRVIRGERIRHKNWVAIMNTTKNYKKGKTKCLTIPGIA